MRDGEARETFLKVWQRDYPETPPINYHFKHHLPKRWIRIHSLPNAQRYPNDKADWAMLLSRQNAVIDYLVPQDTPIQWVWNWIGRDTHIHQSFSPIALGMFSAGEGEPDFECHVLDDVWRTGEADVFLTMIADESMRAFIIAPDCLIAPYDGGMDIILKDPHTAHAFKRHFADWVSPRADGL
jgi:hypothetical protein